MMGTHETDCAKAHDHNEACTCVLAANHTRSTMGIGQQPSKPQRLKFGDEIEVIAFQPPAVVGDQNQERFRIRVHEPAMPRSSTALLTRDELLAHVQECMRVLGEQVDRAGGPAGVGGVALLPRLEAIWLRTDSSPEIERSQNDRDPSGRDQVLRVLVKLVDDPQWRIAIEYLVSPTGQLISHISEAHAFDCRPIDPVTAGRPYEEVRTESLNAPTMATAGGGAVEWPAATDGKMVQAAVIRESYGKHPGATLELIDEVDKVRVRVREPSGKASIFLTDTDLDRLGKEVAYMQKRRILRAAAQMERATDMRAALGSRAIVDAVNAAEDAPSRIGVSLAEQTKKVLETLTPREREVLDMRLGKKESRSSQEIRDEIIAEVGMMANARTPEMQARYDAAIERERVEKAAADPGRTRRVAALMGRMQVAKEAGDFYRWLAETIVEIEDLVSAQFLK